MKSRNQREGKFIPGWCYNPAYHKASIEQIKLNDLKPKKRAGMRYDLSFYHAPRVGKVYVRTYREGAFE